MLNKLIAIYEKEAAELFGYRETLYLLQARSITTFKKNQITQCLFQKALPGSARCPGFRLTFETLLSLTKIDPRTMDFKFKRFFNGNLFVGGPNVLLKHMERIFNDTVHINTLYTHLGKLREVGLIKWGKKVNDDKKSSVSWIHFQPNVYASLLDAYQETMKTKPENNVIMLMPATPEDAEKVLVAEEVIKIGGQHPDEIPNPTIAVGLYSSNTNVIAPLSVSTNVDSSPPGKVETEALASGLNISGEDKNPSNNNPDHHAEADQTDKPNTTSRLSSGSMPTIIKMLATEFPDWKWNARECDKLLRLTKHPVVPLTPANLQRWIRFKNDCPVASNSTAENSPFLAPTIDEFSKVWVKSWAFVVACDHSVEPPKSSFSGKTLSQ